MNNRFFGMIIKVSDEYSVVANFGSNREVKEGQKFIVVGVGEHIIDPESGEDLGALEVVRGKVVVTHVQEKMSTLTSCETERDRDTKETRRQAPNTGSVLGRMFGDVDTVTEVTKLGAERRKPLLNPAPGDFLIRA